MLPVNAILIIVLAILFTISVLDVKRTNKEADEPETHQPGE